MNVNDLRERFVRIFDLEQDFMVYFAPRPCEPDR